MKCGPTNERDRRPGVAAEAANGDQCHDGIRPFHQHHEKGKSMNIITVGIDLAKNVFSVHGVIDDGKPALFKPKVSRADLLPFIAQLLPCLIGMAACSARTTGAAVPATRPHRQTDGAEVRRALSHDRQARQERCGGCRGDLRGRRAPEHAIRPGQGRTPTDHPVSAPAPATNPPPSSAQLSPCGSMYPSGLSNPYAYVLIPPINPTGSLVIYRPVCGS